MYIFSLARDLIVIIRTKYKYHTTIPYHVLRRRIIPENWTSVALLFPSQFNVLSLLALRINFSKEQKYLSKQKK